MSIEDLFRMLEDQEYLCSICKTDLGNKNPKNIHIDHCHETKKVRGILCNSCNMALGLLKEDVSIINACLTYLEKHRAAAHI